MSPNPATYLRLCLAFVLVLALGVIAFNAVVSPFNHHQSLLLSGVNAIKTEFHRYVRTGKALELWFVQPRAVAMGTSMAEYGLSPNHRGWGEQPVYNLALLNSTIHEMEQYLRHAVYVAGTRQVVMGLDMVQFDSRRYEIPGYEQNALVDQDSTLTRLRAMLAQWPTLYSDNALRISLMTIRRQGEVLRTPLYTGNGQRIWQEDLSERGGQRAFFQLVDSYFLNGAMCHPATAISLHLTSSAPHDHFQSLRKMLAFAHERQLDLRLFFSPDHVRLWHLLLLTGRWEEWEGWKRRVVAIVEEANRAHPERPPIPLWDFNIFHPLTEEPIPAAGDLKGLMRWHWDPSHYRAELGDRVLDRVFGMETAPLEEGMPPFGTRLNAISLEEHLAAQRRGVQAWRERFPEEVREMEQKVARALDGRASGPCRFTPGPPTTE